MFILTVHQMHDAGRLGRAFASPETTSISYYFDTGRRTGAILLHTIRNGTIGNQTVFYTRIMFPPPLQFLHAIRYTSIRVGTLEFCRYRSDNVGIWKKPTISKTILLISVIRYNNTRVGTYRCIRYLHSKQNTIAFTTSFIESCKSTQEICE